MISCPACQRYLDENEDVYDAHFDSIGQKYYKLFDCRCGVTFANPRHAVGPEWYSMVPRSTEVDQSKDKRFRHFFNGIPIGRLLDIGCGDGNSMLKAKALGFEACGIDFDDRMVGICQSYGLDAHVMEFETLCRLRSFDKEGAFDVITLFDFLEHMPEPKDFLLKVRNLLKPGGYLLINLPNANRAMPFGRDSHDYPPQHFSRWTARGMKDFLERNGFEVIRQEASDLRLFYLAEMFFYFGLIRTIQSFRKPKPEIDESESRLPILTQAGLRLDRKEAAARKQKLSDNLKMICLPLSYTVAVILWIYYRITRSEAGDYLYTSARKT